MKKYIYLFLMIFATNIIIAQENSSRGYKVSVGDKCHDFEINFIDGDKIKLSELKGKLIVLQFTASWCSVCRKEMPHLETEVWQRFKGDDFVLIGIDLKEDINTVKAFKEKMNVTYPMALDLDGSVFESFTLPKSGVTRNIVIDKKGEIIFLTRLYDRNEFEQMIKVIENEIKKS